LFDFIKSSSIYIFGSIINGIYPLLLLPIFTRLLLPVDFGIFATSVVLVRFYTIILGFESEGLIARSYYESNKEKHNDIISIGIMLSFISSLILVAGLLLFQNSLYYYSKFPKDWSLINVLIAFFVYIQSIFFSVLQTSEKPLKYILLSFVFNTINYSIAAYLIIYQSMAWEGRIIATTLAGLAGTIFSIYSLIKMKKLSFKINKSDIKDFFLFGIPLFPHALGGVVISTVPIFYLNNMKSLSDTGLYSVGLNIASVIMLVVMASNKAYLPALFKRLQVLENQKKIIRVLLIATVIVPIIGLSYGLIIKILLPLILGQKFIGVEKFVIWLSLAFSMKAIFLIFEKFVIYNKDTKLISWTADFIGALAIIIFCPILININGALGAAQATFIAFFISAVGGLASIFLNNPRKWLDALKPD